MTFQPCKSISSRYAQTIIVPNQYYSSISGSGNTGTASGYIYVPYIIAQNTPIISDYNWRERGRQELRKKRKEKLNKLGWY